MECYCYLRNIQDLLSDGKTPYERRFGMPCNGPVIPFGPMVEYHPISAKDISRSHQFGPKVLPGLFLRCGDEGSTSRLTATRLQMATRKARHWPSSERDETSITDSGAVCSTCPPGFAPLATLEDAAEERPLRAANGLDLENFGMKVVKQEVKLVSGKPTQVLTKYRAANVQRPIISLSEAANGGNIGFFSKVLSGIARAGDIEIVVKGDHIPLKQKGALFEMGVLDAAQGDG